jgi:membrane-bound serine protease (ClpP class)
MSKETVKDWVKILVLLLDDVVVVAAVLAVLWYFDIGIPLWVSVTLGVLLGGVVILIHMLVIPSFHRKKVTGEEGMVGLRGKVVEPLKPEGTVHIDGEYWKARSVNGEIDKGERVEVLAVRDLVLEVKRGEK